MSQFASQLVSGDALQLAGCGFGKKLWCNVRPRKVSFPWNWKYVATICSNTSIHPFLKPGSYPRAKDEKGEGRKKGIVSMESIKTFWLHSGWTTYGILLSGRGGKGGGRRHLLAAARPTKTLCRKLLQNHSFPKYRNEIHQRSLIWFLTSLLSVFAASSMNQRHYCISIKLNNSASWFNGLFRGPLVFLASLS